METRIDTTLKAIDNEVCALNLYWKLFNQLFCTTETVDLLNNFAPSATRIIQTSLLDAIILRICRLTDPAESNVRGQRVENLTLANLLLNMPASNTAEFNRLLQSQLDCVKAACDDLRMHRNKSVAHRDKDTAMNNGESLPSLVKSKFQKAIEQINRFMNILNKHKE